MPTYEYECKQCGERFEIFQSFTDKPLKRHDACGGEVKKVFHARGVVFKGSGFYVTDSRGAKSATAAPASESTGSEASTSSSSSSTSSSDSSD